MILTDAVVDIDAPELNIRRLKCPSISQSFCPSFSLSVCLSISLSVCLIACPSDSVASIRLLSGFESETFHYSSLKGELPETGSGDGGHGSRESGLKGTRLWSEKGTEDEMKEGGERDIGEDQGKWMDNVWIETRGDEMKERSSGCGECGEGWKWRVNGSNDRRKSITTGWRRRLEDKRSTGKLGKQNGCGTVHGNGQRRKDI